MSGLSLTERIRELFLDRRFHWAITIFFGVAVVLWFLLVTLFFNPFEKPLGPLSSVVPREADYFMNWKGAGDRFESFPELSVLSDFKASEQYAAWEAAGLNHGIEQQYGPLFEELKQVASALPVGLNIEKDLLQDVALAGRGAPVLAGRFDGVLMFRASMVVRAGVEALGFGFVRNKLPSSLGVEEHADGRWRIPQFPPFGHQDAWLMRLKDVILIASREDWLDKAHELSIRSGQDSLAQASVYHDHVEAHIKDQSSPLKIFLRRTPFQELVGTWPVPQSQGFWDSVLSRFFSTDVLRFLSGYWQPGKKFSGRFSGDVDLTPLPPFGQSWAEGKPLGKQDILTFAGMVPTKSFLFGAVAGDPGRVALQIESAMAPDIRRILDETVISSGQFQGVAHLLEGFDEALSSGFAFALRPNDFPSSALDVEHDDAPVPAFVVMARLRSGEKFNALIEFFKNNFHRFAGGGDRPKLTTVPLGGGTEGLSFATSAIPGTGEFVVLEVPSKRMVFLSNSYNYLREITEIAFLDNQDPRASGRKLVQTEGLQNLVNSLQGGAKAFVWAAPNHAEFWAEQWAEAQARVQFQNEMDAGQYQQWRPQEEARVRKELFDGRTTLSAAEQVRLQDAVDEALFARAEGSWESRKEGLLATERNRFLAMKILDWCGVTLALGRRQASIYLSGQLNLD
ncbi:MAG: hypothetical protein MK213_05860 [Planctomycetes bacterium]|nr:hypothetical protein [Planctomycetota bacterium]